MTNDTNRRLVMEAINNGATSCREISYRLGIDIDDVADRCIELYAAGLIDLDDVEAPE